jgi:hypothetical protein
MPLAKYALSDLLHYYWIFKVKIVFAYIELPASEK